MSKLEKIVLENGLPVYLYEDKTKHNVICEYNVKFGFYDKCHGIENINGAAHFLEHTLVEKCKHGNYLNIFSDNFAYSNAFTTPNQTGYYFDCVEDFEKSLIILLDAVEDATFKENDINDVRGAIYKEINMLNDKPLRKMNNTMLENLFISIDEASGIGTKEDIDKINYDILKKIYNKFYNYDNMFLIIGGNIDIKKTSKLLKEIYKKRNILKTTTQKNSIHEKDNVVKKYEIINSKISGTIVNVAFKINIAKNFFNIKYIYSYFNFYLDLMFTKSSLIYQDLMEKDVIKYPLSVGTFLYGDYFVFYIFSKIDEQYEDYYINEIVKNVQSKKINLENFDKVKRNYIAGFMDYSENLYYILDSLKENIIKYNVENVDQIEDILKINKEDLQKLINSLNFDNYTVVKVQNEK